MKQCFTGLMRLLMLFVAGVTVISAQVEEDLLNTVDAEFLSNNTIPKIGEPFELMLTVTYPDTVEILGWPTIESEWGSFEIISSGDLTTRDLANGIKQTSQTITAVLWRPGDYTTPSTFVLYRRIGETDVLRVVTTDAFFSVFSILPSQDLNTLEFLPNKSAIWVFYIPLWGYGLGLLVLSVVVCLSGWLWQAYRRELNRRRVKPARTPFDEAVESVEGLQLIESLSERISLTAYIMRNYLTQRFSFPATNMTTLEIRQAIDELSLFNPEQAQTLYAILEWADKVKFAGAEPTRQLTQQIADSVLEWLRYTEQGITH